MLGVLTTRTRLRFRLRPASRFWWLSVLLGTVSIRDVVGEPHVGAVGSPPRRSNIAALPAEATNSNRATFSPGPQCGIPTSVMALFGRIWMCAALSALGSSLVQGWHLPPQPSTSRLEGLQRGGGFRRSGLSPLPMKARTNGPGLHHGGEGSTDRQDGRRAGTGETGGVSSARSRWFMRRVRVARRRASSSERRSISLLLRCPRIARSA